MKYPQLSALEKVEFAPDGINLTMVTTEGTQWPISFDPAGLQDEKRDEDLRHVRPMCAVMIQALPSRQKTSMRNANTRCAIYRSAHYKSTLIGSDLRGLW